MPVNKALTYFDLTDFSAGEFVDPGSGNQLLMPNTGAQQMYDVYPQPGGGLRGFFTSTSFTTSGLVHAADEECTGIFVVGGYARRSGTGGQGANGSGEVYYMTTWDESRNEALFYRMDTTGGQTSWSHLHTTASTADAASSRYQTGFVHFIDSSGNDYVIVALRSSIDRGLFTWLYDAAQADSEGGSDGTVTRYHTYDGALTVAQARIIVGSHETSDDQTLYYSDVGSVSFSGGTAGTLIPSPSYPRNAIEYLATIDPDQIVVGFRGAPWVTITGDINSANTPVRQMGAGHYPNLQEALRTPEGLVFMTDHGPAYLTDGNQFTNITPYQLGFANAGANGNFGGLGVGTYEEGFLFLPHGQVRFEETKGWFETSDSDAVYYASDPSVGVIEVTNDVNFTIRTRSVSRRTATRVSSWTWRSAPIAQQGGTQTEVREVVILGECTHTCSYSITLTDHLGNTQTVNTRTLAAGKHATSVPMKLRGDYVDVKIVATASSGEAPIVERVRLGMGMGHSL